MAIGRAYVCVTAQSDSEFAVISASFCYFPAVKKKRDKYAVSLCRHVFLIALSEYASVVTCFFVSISSPPVVHMIHIVYILMLETLDFIIHWVRGEIHRYMILFCQLQFKQQK